MKAISSSVIITLVEECIFHFGTRICLQYVVLTTERISVVIGEMLNYLLHILSLISASLLRHYPLQR